jgi:hypothetical protein
MARAMTTYKVLTIRQPWASLIVDGVKPVENRSWITNHRGPLLIHAGKAWSNADADDIFERFGLTLNKWDMTFGAVIGIADLVDVVDQHKSPWFCGPYAWVLRNARPIKPIPMNGQLGLFNHTTKRALR